MSGHELPKQNRPFAEDVADIKGIEHPGPLGIIQPKVFFEAGRLCVPDVSWVVNSVVSLCGLAEGG